MVRTKISEIEAGAVVAWSPVGDHADVIALGSKVRGGGAERTPDPTGFDPSSLVCQNGRLSNGSYLSTSNGKQEKGGTGFDDYGGELELYDLNITGGLSGGRAAAPSRLGSVKTPARFGCIAWGGGLGPGGSLAGGGSALDGTVVAGGMTDGTVNLWRPSSLLDGGDGAPLSAVDGTSPVTSVGFNPHGCSSHLLAAGTSTGEVRIVDLTDPSSPTSCGPGGAGAGAGSAGGEVTRAAWNSQVSHILATSSASGAVVVWDVRQARPWCELRAEPGAGGGVSDVAWNPVEGLHLMTGGGGGPGQLKLWDLRASTSVPLTSLDGHPGGVLGME